MREWRKTHGLNPEQRRKANVRSIAKEYAKRGLIHKANECAKCGAQNNTQLHHPDYSKPTKGCGANPNAMGRVPTPLEAVNIANSCDFGCADCLVIQEPEVDHFHEPLSERYRAVFNNPEANPRWEHKADYTEVIQL